MGVDGAREPLPAVARLSPLVVRVLGLNPGEFTLQGTNCYLVGAGPRRFLVEAGQGVAGFVPALRAALADHGADGVSDVIITHYHADHSEGLLQLRREFGPGLRAWKLDPAYKGPHGPSFDLEAHGVEGVADGQRLRTEDGSATLRVIHTPGHTPDHVCLLLEQEGAVFAGDCVLGGSTTVFEDLGEYLGSLRRLVALGRRETQDSGGECARGTMRLYTGHGPHIDDGVAALEACIAHRETREAQIVQQLVHVDAGVVVGGAVDGGGLDQLDAQLALLGRDLGRDRRKAARRGDRA